jgi:NADH:quinone reductase (non-electrogenic)
MSARSRKPTRLRVLILGGGFAGIGAARKLKDAEVDVVLVDKHDYHTFQPLLYQVATDLLETSAVGHPLRDLFHDQPNAAVHGATVTAIDLDTRTVEFAEMPALTYDYLVLALGAEVNFFGVSGAAEHAFPLYTLADAARLKDHILERWEAADRDPRQVEDGALSVVVVGGGPTGIESVGAMAELYRGNFAKDYPQLPQHQARLVLVEAGPVLFPMFKADIRAYTQRLLEKRQVEVMVDEVVASVAPTRVTLKSGRVLKAHTLIWGAGLQGGAVVRSLGLELQRGHRIPVGPDLALAQHPEVFAVGDIAWITDTKTREVLPQLGSVALQAGERAGENISLLAEGKAPEAFVYDDKGTMATIGRAAAVIQTRRGRTIKGKSASLAWGAVHLALLSTGEDRAKAVVDWTWAGFTHERAARIRVTTAGEAGEPDAAAAASGGAGSADNASALARR